MSDHQQDWDRVVLSKDKKPKKIAPGASSHPTERRFAAGSNAKRSDNNMAKLDNETEAFSRTFA